MDRTRKEEDRGFDILVNNAGVPVFGHFSTTPMEDELAMLQMNTASLTELTKLFLPEMLSRKQGRVLNVASIAGFFPGPGMAVYFATKAYVLSFTQALHHELRGTGVTATALCPGATRTRFMERGSVEKSRLSEHRMMNAERVAIAGYRGMLQGKRTVVPGLGNKIMVGLSGIVPRSLATAGTAKAIGARPPDNR